MVATTRSVPEGSSTTTEITPPHPGIVTSMTFSVSENSVSPVARTAPAHLEYRPDIDGLRAIAVLAVVCFHVAPKRIVGGFVGVDIFFVISGYLISSIILSGLNSGKFSYREFYIRRIRRIFPALMLMFAACLIAGWYLLLPDEYRLLGKHTVASSLFAANFVLWSEAGYFDAQSSVKPYLHLWSLGVEEQFYIVWPLVLAALWKYSRAPLIWIVAGAIASFLLCVAVQTTSPTAAFYSPATRFWQLLVGVALAFALARPAVGRGYSYGVGSLLFNRAWIGHTLGWVGLVLLAGAIFLVDSQSSFPGIRAGIPTLGSALVLCAGPDAHINRHVLSNRVMVAIGLISYPLYLWHWPLLSFLNMLQPDGPERSSKLAAVALAFALATATYLLIEKPVRTPPFVKSRWLLGSAVACLMAGAVVYFGGGLAEQRGPWAITRTPERFEQTAMQTAECLNRNAKIFQPRVLAERDFCVGSAPGPRDVVIVGDSHAARLFHGLKSIDGTRSYLDIGRGTCIPFERFDASWPDTGEFLDCATTDANVLRHAADAGAKTVIVHAYFLRAFTGGLRVVQPADFQAEARDTFARLSRAGKQVLVVLDAPVLPFEPAECVARPAFRAKVRSPCEHSHSDWQARSRGVEATLRAATAGIANVRLFDPATVLCPNTHCMAVHDGDLLYSDTHHLSLAGARLVAAAILEILPTDAAQLSIVPTSSDH